MSLVSLSYGECCWNFNLSVIIHLVNNAWCCLVLHWRFIYPWDISMVRTLFIPMLELILWLASIIMIIFAVDLFQQLTAVWVFLKKNLFSCIKVNWLGENSTSWSMDNFSPIPTLMQFFKTVHLSIQTWPSLVQYGLQCERLDLSFTWNTWGQKIYKENYNDIGPVNKALNMVSAFHGEFESWTSSLSKQRSESLTHLVQITLFNTTYSGESWY